MRWINVVSNSWRVSGVEEMGVGACVCVCDGKLVHPVLLSGKRPLGGDLLADGEELHASISSDIEVSELGALGTTEGEGFARDGDANVDAKHA